VVAEGAIGGESAAGAVQLPDRVHLIAVVACLFREPAATYTANVADAPFYEMKGLFVTPGATYDGPQITKTALGSKVNLKARIYNYSLANFPAGSVMHVQFYAQPWGIGEFASVPGNPSELPSTA